MPLLLMKELESGISTQGERAPLMVLEDVKGPGGSVVLPRGAAVQAEVAWSRREDALGALANQPARLTLRFDRIGSTSLTADPSGKEAKDYELNRGNTGRPAASDRLGRLAAGSDNEAALAALESLVRDGRVESYAETPEGRRAVSKLAEELGFPATAQIVQEGKLDATANVFRQLQVGKAVAAAATGGTSLALDAAIELARGAGEIGDRLGKMMRGRNIRAYVGTPVTVYVRAD